MSKPFLCLYMNRRDRGPGSILILAVWVLVFFSILCVALSGIISSQIILAKRIESRITCKYLANAAVVYAKQEILTDEDGYCTLYKLRRKREKALGPTGKFVYTLTDEGSKININNAGPEAISSLPGFDTQLAEKVSGSLLKPFHCKEEILLVDGVTDEIFGKCKDLITAYGDGKVNINTAPQEVLEAVGMDEQLASYVIEFRNGPDNKEATEDDGVFRSDGEVLEKLRSSVGLSGAQEASLISVLSRGVGTSASKVFSMQIETRIVDKTALRYTVVLDNEKVKEWREY